MTKFFAGLVIALVCSFAAHAPAAAADDYFAWEIKDPSAYQPHYLLFKAQGKDNVTAMHDEIYQATIQGKYLEAALVCENMEATQKIIFGTDYFDAGLTELAAKLYLAAEDFAAAERKINFLVDKAGDPSAKIRALNLKSDLLNGRGDYRAALKVTAQVTELGAGDDRLSLVNQARTARAYCGLGNVQKSLEIAEKIYPQMQNAFGEAGIETLALMSTLAADYRAAKRFEDCGRILAGKLQLVNGYLNQNAVVTAKTTLEFIDLCFATNESARGEELLNETLKLAANLCDNKNYHAGLQVYKAIDAAATKHLGGNNPIALKAELGTAQLQNSVGNIDQSIALCKKFLPRFKKSFGDGGDETLALMKILGDDYLLLGRYSDSQKIVRDRLNVSQKHFGEHDARTVAAAVDLANVCYRTGKYKSADKLLADIETQSRAALETSPQLQYDYACTKAAGALLKANYIEFGNFFGASNNVRENLPRTDYAQSIDYFIGSTKIYELFEVYGNAADYGIIPLNAFKVALSEHHPKVLDLMNTIAEAYLSGGELAEAEKFTARIIQVSRAHFGEGNFYEWVALNTLSRIRRAEGNFSAALEADNQALKIAEKVCGKNSLERLQTLDSIASDQAAAGNLTEAIKLREQTLADCGKFLEGNDKVTLQMMTNLAENYVAAGRYAEAVKMCDETLAKENMPVYVDGKLTTYANIMALFRIKAQAQKLSGDNVDADANYRQLIPNYESKRGTDQEEFLASRESKARWFAGLIPDYKDAAAVASSEEVGNSEFAFYCMEFCKGRNLIDRYDDVLIAKSYMLTSRDKKRLADYQQLLTSCRAVSDYAAATNNDALQSSSELIYGELYLGNSSLTNTLRQKYSNNKIPKDQQQADTKGKRTDWEDILRNFDIAKNRRAIPNGAALVEFMKVSDDSLLIAALSNSSDVRTANISVSKDFFDNCRLYHELNAVADINALHGEGKYLWQTADGKIIITAGRTAPSASAAAINDSAKLDDLRKNLSAQISRVIIPAVEKFAGNSSHWIISPDAELNVVPFETLAYRGKMLVESVDVSYVPSLAVLNLMHKRERKNSYLGQSKELFAMGDALYGEGDAAASRGSQQNFFERLRNNADGKADLRALQWNNLPGTAREIDKVSALFDSKDVFRRSQVTERNLRRMNVDGDLAQYKYLLFATHGLFVPEVPQASAIVLSQFFNDEETDGYITVSEWMGYNLRSDLVYLSACESGLGGYQAGEGIVGIPYALTMAGNKDTVMSLWKVDDEATAEFTSAVFEKLSRGKSEVVALNETKREFIGKSGAKFSSPSVWAAFVLYGI